MSELIQRVPRGLANILSLQSGNTPKAIADEVRGVLEMIQMYGLTQLQFAQANNAAAAEAAPVDVVPSAGNWTIVFAGSVQIAKTATMTALRGSLSYARTSGNLMRVAEAELGPFGATETGVVTVPFFAPYPLICPPGTTWTGSAAVIGTDATASIGVRVEFGLLG